MSDTYKGLIVVLEDDLSKDEIERIEAAIRALRGVLSAERTAPVNVDDYLARVRIDSEWRDRLLKMIRRSWNPPRNPKQEVMD